MARGGILLLSAGLCGRRFEYLCRSGTADIASGLLPRARRGIAARAYFLLGLPGDNHAWFRLRLIPRRAHWPVPCRVLYADPLRATIGSRDPSGPARYSDVVCAYLARHAPPPSAVRR